MAGSQEILGGGYYVSTSAPEEIVIGEPFYITTSCTDATNIPHTFILYIDNKMIQSITVNDYHCDFEYILTKFPNRNSINIFVDLEANLDKQIWTQNSYATCDIVLPSFVNSIYQIYQSLNDIVENTGSIATMNDEGIISLIEKLEGMPWYLQTPSNVMM